MSDESNNAQRLIDAGEHKKAAKDLWKLEFLARRDLAEARSLRELAERLRDVSSGGVQRDAIQLGRLAESHMVGLTREQQRGQELADPGPGATRGFVAGTALGGYGWNVRAGGAYYLDFDADGVMIHESPTGETTARVAYKDLLALEIGGPGRVTSGGGFAGGGFGLEGAAEGVLAASVLNAVSTRSKTVTTFSLYTRDAEAFFLHDELTPQDLRIRLSEVFVRMRQAASARAASPIAEDKAIG